MNSLILNSPLWFPSLLSSQSSPHSRSIYTYHSICPPRPLSIRRQQQQTFAVDAVPSNEGVVSVINFEDLLEKDWSFLDSDGSNSVEQIDRIISAGEIDKTSRVLISTGSGDLVDRVVDSSPCSLLLVVHDSLFVLAGIKEKYDKVKCWQGEVIYVPEKWVPLDVVFLYFLPALPFTLDQVLEALASRVSPGARIVISHPQGREVLEQQRKQYPDVIVSDLPDEMTLQKAATHHSFQVAQFVDEPTFYLAVLKFCEVKT